VETIVGNSVNFAGEKWGKRKLHLGVYCVKYDILKIKNVLAKYIYSVREYIVFAVSLLCEGKCQVFIFFIFYFFFIKGSSLLNIHFSSEWRILTLAQTAEY